MKNIAEFNRPVVMAIAGSDPSGGAGIQADIKVFESLGVHGLSALSCTTAQIPGSVIDINPVTSDHLTAQIDLLLGTYPVSAIKTGMLCSIELVETVMSCLERNHYHAPLIVDPVMRASSGDFLINSAGVDFYKDSFISSASLFTPNVDEASVLLDGREVNFENFEQCAADLYARYSTPVLLKGGHLDSDNAIDILVTEKGTTHFSAPYIKGVNPHGTGCTYSAAITAYIALGHSLEKSVSLGKEYITSAIANCVHFEDGQQFLGRPSP
jgi:hydroxymethylpyrimidine/phosphomethylpyrimidine kinase